MRVVIALGGNALLRRGEPLTATNQRTNIAEACRGISTVVPGNEVVIAHGNGPQVGLLALQAAAYTEVEPYPLDVLGAQTEAMIGYVIEQELGNLLGPGTDLATVLTQIEVDADDPAFAEPDKPIGPVYDEQTARRLADEKGWSVRRDGEHHRRVVASPAPKRLLEARAITTLVDAGLVVVCAGGGGIPVVAGADGRLRGVEAVIDKDRAAALLAAELDADLLVIATDVDGVYDGWRGPSPRLLGRVTPHDLAALDLAAGSMGPKAEAAAAFVRATGGRAAIGALADIERLVDGTAGTQVVADDSEAPATS